MSMRAISTTMLKFGSMGIGLPVKLYKARDEADGVHFKNGCGCGGQLHHENICSACGKKVEYQEIVKLYDMGGKLVPVDKEKLPKLEGGDLSIRAFVSAGEFAAFYAGRGGLAFREFYSVGWDKKKAKAATPLGALFSVMVEKNLIGMGKMVMRSKEHKVALLAINGGLYVATLATPTDIRENEFHLEGGKTLADMAAFIEALKAPIDADFWTDHTSEAIRQMIEGGVPIEQKEPEGDFFSMVAVAVQAKKKEAMA